LGQLAHVTDHRRMSAVRWQRRRDNLRTVYRLWTGGVSRGDRSDLHCAAWMDHRNGTATHPGDVDGACRRFSWRGSFIRTGSTFSLRWRPKSCNWNIDSARHKFHLVGRFALFASFKTCALTVPHCRSTNDLWRNVAFGCRRRYRRTAALSLESYFNVIARLIYLPRAIRSRGRIYRLHLAVASL